MAYQGAPAQNVTASEAAIREKATAILEASYRISNVADTIREKVFGPIPCETGKPQEPQCLDDILNIAYGILLNASDTLGEINGRL